MRVDLVMHKEVSPSVNSYIGEIVPILSGLDYERGDEFVFVPIIPNLPEIQPDLEKPNDTDTETKALAKIESPEEQQEEKPFWQTLGTFEAEFFQAKFFEGPFHVGVAPMHMKAQHFVKTRCRIPWFLDKHAGCAI